MLLLLLLLLYIIITLLLLSCCSTDEPAKQFDQIEPLLCIHLCYLRVSEWYPMLDTRSVNGTLKLQIQSLPSVTKYSR